MADSETDALGIGIWVAHTAASLWLDDPRLSVAGDLVAMLSPRIIGTIERRRLVRELDQIADTVAESLLAAQPDQFDCSPDEFRRAISAVRATLDQARLAGVDRSQWNPSSFFVHITGITAMGTIDAYDAVMRATCIALSQTLSILPYGADSIESGAIAAVLQDSGGIARALQLHLPAALSQSLHSPGDDFDERYRRFVAESMDRLELVGLRPERRSWFSLAEAFVAPSVRNTSISPAVQPFVDALATCRMVVLRGAPGAGKTTALRWLALQAARGELPDRSAELNRSMPLFVQLRGWTDSTTGAGERLAGLIAAPPGAPLPAEWVQRRLGDGSALVLADGLDELPEPQRSAAWTWLRGLETTFPDTRLVVSSRPTALRRYLPDDRFEVVDLMPMTEKDIVEFVQKWYRTTSRTDDHRTGDWAALPAAIASNPHLGRLASSPLMCSLLCALTAERTTALPRNHEIYQTVLDMLLNRRDADLRGEHDLRLGYVEKIILLAQIAYWFLTNQFAEADRNAVVAQLAIELHNMPQVSARPEHVLESLTHTSGVLRESVSGRIEFVHQTLQEYLAARAVLDQGATGLLVRLAHESQWRDVTMLAAGQATRRDCENLVGGLLERADVESHYRDRLLDIARNCLADRPDIWNSAAAAALEGMGSRQPSARAQHGFDPRRVIIAVDIERFSEPSRTSAHQVTIRGALHQILQTAFGASGCPWKLCAVQDQGDGALIVSPPGLPRKNLWSRLPRELVDGLQAYNSAVSAEARIRLRLAAHAGDVHGGAQGYSGVAAVTAARLRDAQAVRDALRTSSGTLATILSDSFHREVAEPSDRYDRCSVAVKEFAAEAWVRVYGEAEVLPGDPVSRRGKPSRIVDGPRREPREWEPAVELEALQEQARQASPAHDVLAVLRTPGIGVIAEVSRGQADAMALDPVRQAREFERGGACAISVPAGTLRAGGPTPDAIADLAAIRQVVTVPVLYAGIIMTPYQLYEARAHGADMVLLVAATFDQAPLAALLERTEALGMTAVVRAHSIETADRALEAGTRIISIDAGEAPAGHKLFERIAAELPVDVVRIAEAARCSQFDLVTYQGAGANAVMVGASLVHAGDPRTAIRRLVTAGEHTWSHRTS